jgi:hypothetical protein
MFVRAFEPDEDYDHDLASDGVSRYGAYLAQHRRRFAGDGQPTADTGEFAAAAWRIAQPPIMVPPYVRTHGRVQDTSVRWDEDRHLAACVELAVSSPPEAAGLAYPWRGWTRDEHGRWLIPVDYARPHAVAVLCVAVPLAGVSLPSPRYRDGAPDTTTAKRAVLAICATLNAALVDVFAFDPLPADAR